MAVTPLLIASFAFNFNDFGKIYLLTGGGPQAEDQSVAGSTDILISYTYKLAFAAGKGTDYGLAAALSLVIFVIVGGISGGGVLALQIPGGMRDDASSDRSRRAQRVAERKRKRPRHLMRGNWWRHLVAWAAIAMALFPVAYVSSAAFNADQTLRGASLIPRAVTLRTKDILRPEPASTTRATGLGTSTRTSSRVAAVLNVMLGALAAYAFSRFRFRGRRFGMMALLLIQMFPSCCWLVAIYLILLEDGRRVPDARPQLVGADPRLPRRRIGREHLADEGFFDTIPSELDESARSTARPRRRSSGA